MSEENIHVDTLVTEDMSKDELYDYAKYLEYRKEELLNINHSLQQKVEQLEKENKELKQPQVFIDCENMEERYGRDLYEDYLKEKIEQLENIRKEAIEYITTEQLYTNYQWGKSQYVKILKDLLNILNKGDNNVKDKR